MSGFAASSGNGAPSIPQVHKIDPKRCKTVRLFILSTLKDGNAEHKTLAEELIPDLRGWCRSRKLRLIDEIILLEEATETADRDTLKLFASELSRSDDEETEPLFLYLVDITGRTTSCITSHEYFWNFAAQFGKATGLTASAVKNIEQKLIGYGSNCVFLLREVQEEKIITADEEDFGSEGVICSLEGAQGSSSPRYFVMKQHDKDSQKVTLQDVSYETYPSVINQILQQRTEVLFPFDSSLSDPLQSLIVEQEMFLHSRSLTALGREDMLNAVVDYVSHGSPSNAPLIVVGLSGAGKTTFMAKCVEKTKMLVDEGKLGDQNTNDQNVKVFFHFVGATPRSTHYVSFLQRLTKELKPHAMEVQGNLDSLVNQTYNSLQNPNSPPIVVFLDALNQMDTEKEDILKRWLPESLSANVRVVISTIEGSNSHKMLRYFKTNPREITCGPLDVLSRQNIITNIFQSYSMKVSKHIVSMLLSKEGSKLPLWLTLACEELKILANPEQFAEKIISLPNDLIDLEECVFARLEELDKGDLIKACLCLLEVSRHGLLEIELLELLAQKEKLISPSLHVMTKELPQEILQVEPSGTASKERQFVPDSTITGNLPISKSVDGMDCPPKSGQRMKKRKVQPQLSSGEWAIVYGSLKSLLRPCGDPGEGRLDFYHRSLSKAVRRRYFTHSDNEEGKKVKFCFCCSTNSYNEERSKEFCFWHGVLADYFEGVEDMDRKVEELPYHLEQLKDNNRLVQCLSDWHVFKHLYCEDFSPDLLHAWQQCGGYGVAVATYKQQLAALNNSEMELSEYAMMVEKVYGFFIQAGRYLDALDLIEERLDKESESQGGRAKELADLYYNMAWCKSEILKAEITYGGADNDRLIIEYCLKSIALRNIIVSNDNEYQCGLCYIMIAHHRSEVADIDAADPKEEIRKSYEALAEADKIFRKLSDLGHIAECVMTKAIIDRDLPLEEKEPLLLEALDLCLKGYGERHVLLRRIYANMADMYDFFRKKDRAFEYYVKTRDTDIALFGMDHPKTRRSLNLLMDEPYATMLKVREKMTAETA